MRTLSVVEEKIIRNLYLYVHVYEYIHPTLLFSTSSVEYTSEWESERARRRSIKMTLWEKDCDCLLDKKQHIVATSLAACFHFMCVYIKTKLLLLQHIKLFMACSDIFMCFPLTIWMSLSLSLSFCFGLVASRRKQKWLRLRKRRRKITT
jgi:hypothetical protein